MSNREELSQEYIQKNREDIGRQIQLLREKKGLSQEQLAEIMQVNRSTISKIEGGKFSVTLDYLIKLAWYLDFNITLLEERGI